MDVQVTNINSLEKIDFKGLADADAALILVLQEILAYIKIIANSFAIK